MEKLRKKFEELQSFCLTSSGVKNIASELKLEQEDLMNYMYLKGQADTYLQIHGKIKEFIENNLSGRDILPTTAEAIKREAYDEGYRNARKFYTYEIVKNLQNASFNKKSSRSALSKADFLRKLDDYLEFLLKDLTYSRVCESFSQCKIEDLGV